MKPRKLKFVGCPWGVKRVSGGCPVGVWRVSGGCLAGVWRVSGGCLEGIFSVSGGCFECVWWMSRQRVCLQGIKMVSGGYLESVWKVLKFLLTQNIFELSIFGTQNLFGHKNGAKQNVQRFILKGTVKWKLILTYMMSNYFRITMHRWKWYKNLFPSSFLTFSSKFLCLLTPRSV